MIIRLYKAEQGYIDYDPHVPCLVGYIDSYMTSEEFRSFMMKGLELIHFKVKEHGKLAWIADLKKSDVFDLADTEWASQYWHAEAHKAGMACAAFVTPENVFAVTNMEEFMERADREIITSNSFSDLEDAKRWCSETLKSR
jgi:hypothetical protein